MKRWGDLFVLKCGALVILFVKKGVVIIVNKQRMQELYDGAVEQSKKYNFPTMPNKKKKPKKKNEQK